jgi:hypothetical protein
MPGAIASVLRFNASRMVACIVANRGDASPQQKVRVMSAQ